MENESARMLRNVDLQTADGSQVVTVKVPAFKTMPEVVIWGDRVFKLALAALNHVAPTKLVNPNTQYREVFAYVATEVVEVKKE